MVFYSSILGVPIICSDNTKIGIVKEVLYCSKRKVVFGLIIEERGIFKSIKFISIEHIKEVNETCLVTDSLDCIEGIEEPENFCNKIDKDSKLGMNTFVYSKDGKLIGQVKDIIFDFKSYSIHGYVISKSYLEDIFSNRIILKDDVEVDENLCKFRLLNSC